jgi:hypothetical protein
MEDATVRPRAATHANGGHKINATSVMRSIQARLDKVICSGDGPASRKYNVSSDNYQQIP